MILFQTNSNILSRLKKKKERKKKPRKLFQKRFIRIPFLSNSSTLPSFHSSPEKAKSAANAADSLNPRMRTTFSSGEIAVVNPRRVNSENRNLPPSWRRNGRRRRRKSREESVLDFIMTRLYASYTCVHGRKKCWKGYTGKGDGVTTGQSEGDGKQGNCPSSELYSTISNGFQDPLQRRSFFTSWIWIVLHGSRTGTLVLRTIRLFID